LGSKLELDSRFEVGRRVKASLGGFLDELWKEHIRLKDASEELKWDTGQGCVYCKAWLLVVITVRWGQRGLVLDKVVEGKGTYQVHPYLSSVPSLCG